MTFIAVLVVIIKKGLSDPTHTPAQEHSTSQNTSVPPKKAVVKLVKEISLQLYCSVLPLTLGTRHESKDRPSNTGVFKVAAPHEERKRKDRDG